MDDKLKAIRDLLNDTVTLRMDLGKLLDEPTDTGDWLDLLHMCKYRLASVTDTLLEAYGKAVVAAERAFAEIGTPAT